eukprot:1158001-Pelagomonas_calceolata.AAC.8
MIPVSNSCSQDLVSNDVSSPPQPHWLSFRSAMHVWVYALCLTANFENAGLAEPQVQAVRARKE